MPSASEDTNLKTIHVDLGFFGGQKQTKPRTYSSSQKPTDPNIPTAKDIAGKTAALQAAVEEALSSASAPRPLAIPRASEDKQYNRPQLLTTPPLATSNFNDDVKEVVSNLAEKKNVNNLTPKEEVRAGISNAVEELNQLMTRRMQKRLMKTQREKRTKETTRHLPSAVANNEQASTALPKWGNLKGGSLPTYRKYTKTQRATKQEQTTIAENNVPNVVFKNESTPSIETNCILTNENEPLCIKSKNSMTLKKKKSIYRVGKLNKGKIGLILNPESLSKSCLSNGGPKRNSITARKKMRKAGLLTGSTNVPQRLVDTMLASVEQIGSVIKNN